MLKYGKIKDWIKKMSFVESKNKFDRNLESLQWLGEYILFATEGRQV